MFVPVRFYRHSALATIVSFLGTLTIVIGVGYIFSKEEGCVPIGIAVTLGGGGLMWLASKIADRKAQKKAAKSTAKITPVTPQPPAGISGTQRASGQAATAGTQTARPSAGQQNPGTAGTAPRTPANDPVSPKLTPDQMLQMAAKYASAGDTAKQISTLKQAADAYPKDAALHNQLGIAYRSAKRYRDSFESYKTAVMLDPDNGLYHGNYAVSLMMSGDYSTALNRFERALPLLKKQNSPDYPSFLASYAYTLGQCGYAENALRCLNDAEKAGYKYTDQIRRKLKEIGIQG